MTELDDPGALVGGRYLLGDLLGVGATAAVYEAEDVTGGPRVAIKVLHPHLSDDERAREAFLREARAVQQVQHPNVAAVRVTGLHEAGGVRLAWIALELVTGGSLADRVAATGPMSPVEAAAVLDGVLAALEVAHAVGLVHRDVSPGNVLLARAADDGPVQAIDVRLTDFGLADVTGLAARGRDVLRAGGDDGPGVIGNPQYMSPEQAQGRPVRATGDLYQVGALGYFLLTGQPPYPRVTAHQVLAAHVSAPPPAPSAVAPAAHPLDQVITHAMAKAPARRFRDVAEFRAALAEAVEGMPAAPDEAADAVVGHGVQPEMPEGGNGPTRVLEPDAEHDLSYLEPAAAPAGPSQPRPAPRSSALAGVVAAVVVATAIWGTVAAAADPDSPATPPPATTTTSAPVSPSPSPTIERTVRALPDPTGPTMPVPALVPLLDGTLDDARHLLEETGLALGIVSQELSAQALNQVLGQWPAAGTQVEPGSMVDVMVASGQNSVPEVAGMSTEAAAAALEAAGFVVKPMSPSSSAVVGTLPTAGAVQPLGTTVTVLLAAPTPTSTPTPTPTPTPSPTATATTPVPEDET